MSSSKDVDLIEHLQSITLDSFLAHHPQIDERRLSFPPSLPLKIDDPLKLIAAESSYNERAMSYVCSLGGVIGADSSYKDKYIVQSQIMAAFSVEEGGFQNRGFLDPHSSLREFMIEKVEEITGSELPTLKFAAEASKRMGEIYLWIGDRPVVEDPFAAMLGAHFGSEYLAASQEFPSMVRLFERDQSEMFDKLRNEVEPHFGFSASAWLEGHPAVELKHAAYAGRAAEAAAFALDDASSFWESFLVGFTEFCKNDQRYFQELTLSLASTERLA